VGDGFTDCKASVPVKIQRCLRAVEDGGEHRHY
jgi:hypothetical protein